MLLYVTTNGKFVKYRVLDTPKLVKYRVLDIPKLVKYRILKHKKLVKYRVLEKKLYLCAIKLNAMIDKRTLEFILTDQQEELETKSEDLLCHRQEEALVDINSPESQHFVIKPCKPKVSSLPMQTSTMND